MSHVEVDVNKSKEKPFFARKITEERLEMQN